MRKASRARVPADAGKARRVARARQLAAKGLTAKQVSLRTGLTPGQLRHYGVSCQRRVSTSAAARYVKGLAADTGSALRAAHSQGQQVAAAAAACYDTPVSGSEQAAGRMIRRLRDDTSRLGLTIAETRLPDDRLAEYVHRTRTIRIDPRQDPPEWATSLAHELAHACDPFFDAGNPNQKLTGRQERDAEIVAQAVAWKLAAEHGLNADRHSRGYLTLHGCDLSTINWKSAKGRQLKARINASYLTIKGNDPDLLARWEQHARTVMA